MGDKYVHGTLAQVVAAIIVRTWRAWAREKASVHAWRQERLHSAAMIKRYASCATELLHLLAIPSSTHILCECGVSLE
jgi:hypothetical protein